jgi:hypothetical protein
MYCSGCGQALVAGQGFCPRCGRASGLGTPMAPVPPQSYGPTSWLPLASIERRINALAVGWFVYAGISGLFGLIGLAFTHAWMSGHMGDWQDRGFGHHFFNGPMMPFFFLKFARVFLLLRVGLAVLAGWGLMQKASWGRVVAIVVGCLAILHPLLGTALGIWTLVVLLNAPNAAGYEAMARG